MQDAIRRFVESAKFQWFILGMIILAAALVGIETYPSMEERHGGLLHLLDKFVLWIFVVEAVLKMAQHGKKFYLYFTDPWNIFDFLIVAVCFLPVDSQYAAVLRLARILRAMRLVTAVPRLQLLVSTLLRSIPSMGYVSILLALMFYIYGTMGVFLWRDNDPVHFHNLQTSMLSLFRVVTLEDWTDIMYIQMFGSDVYAYANTTGITPTPSASPVVGALYFSSFVMFGTMIMLNLFIGVILSSMDEARTENERAVMLEEKKAEGHISLESEVKVIENDLESLMGRLQVLRSLLHDGHANAAPAPPRD